MPYILEIRENESRPWQKGEVQRITVMERKPNAIQEKGAVPLWDYDVKWQIHAVFEDTVFDREVPPQEPFEVQARLYRKNETSVDDLFHMNVVISQKTGHVSFEGWRFMSVKMYDSLKADPVVSEL